MMSRLFSFAVQRGYIELNPVSGTAIPSQEKKRDRYLSVEEIRKLWIGLPDAKMSESVQWVIQLLLFTGQRVGEITSLRLQDIDFDRKCLTISAEESKNKKPHVVPLTSATLDILSQAIAIITGQSGCSRHTLMPTGTCA